jgi:hypothetical protein
VAARREQLKKLRLTGERVLTCRFPILDDKLVLKMFSSYAEPLMKMFAAIWPSDVATLEKFQWAYSMVSSR